MQKSHSLKITFLYEIIRQQNPTIIKA